MLSTALKNGNLLGNDRYLAKITSAYEIFCRYGGSASGQSDRQKETIPDVTFNQAIGNENGNPMVMERKKIPLRVILDAPTPM